MRLTPPTKNVFWISTVVAVLGLILSFIAATSGFAIWVVFIGFALLWLGNSMKGF